MVNVTGPLTLKEIFDKAEKAEQENLLLYKCPVIPVTTSTPPPTTTTTVPTTTTTTTTTTMAPVTCPPCPKIKCPRPKPCPEVLCTTPAPPVCPAANCVECQLMACPPCKEPDVCPPCKSETCHPCPPCKRCICPRCDKSSLVSYKLFNI